MKPTKTFRVECSGGCGAWVLKTQGECRKCRRARILAGNRHLRRLGEAIPQRNSSGIHVAKYAVLGKKAVREFLNAMFKKAFEEAHKKVKNDKALPAETSG